MLVIFLVIAPSTLASDISTVKSEPDEDVKEIMYHNGNLIVEGGETYVIENVTFFIDGNIFVEEDSTLLIQNSEIILESRFFTHYNAYLRGNAKFIAENSTLESRGHHTVMFKVGDGTLMLSNTEYEWQIHASGGIIVITSCKSTRAPIFFQGGEITISDSEVYVIGIPVNSEEESVFELDNLHPGFNKHLIIKRSHGNKILELTNTFVSGWVVDVGSGTRLTYENLVVKNSVLSGLWFWFHTDSYVEISDLELGYFSHWKMREEWKLEGVTYNVELINTTVTDLYKLQIYGQALIENVSGAQVAPRGSAFVYVKNSTIDPNLVLRGNEYVILEDTEVGGVELEEDRSIRPARGGIHLLELRGAQITGMEIASNYTLIKGEGIFNARFEDINWAFGIVEREFPVIVEFEGNPYPNASLNLVDSSGSLIWNGKTDANGTALFNLTFTVENYAERHRLLATLKDRTISRKVNFLSDTPVVLTFDEHYVDGDIGDWSEIPPLVTDESGDSLAEYGDLRALYAILGDNYLYIAVEIYDEEFENTTENLVIEIDSDFDGKRDYVINVYHVRNEETHEESQIVESVVDRVIELRVPLEGIGNPDEFNIGAHIVYQISENKRAASDKMEGWTLISRRSSIYIDISSNQILRGENLTVSGEISPYKIGAPITLTYQMPNGSLLTRNVTSTDIGVFNFTFRPDIVGSWIVNASWEGDLSHNGASSQTTSFTVVEPEQTTDEEPKSGGILGLSYELVILGLVFGFFIIWFARARWMRMILQT